MESHKQTRQTIIRLLSSMASAKEISQYVKRFSQLDAKRFAVVKVGGAVLRDDLESLTSSLTFLQEVGLTPIVVHGAGPQLDEEMTAAGITKQTVNGLRVTTPEVLAIVRKVFLQQNLALVEELRRIAGQKGVSVAQIAIAWVAAQGKDIVPLVGARRRDRLTEALGSRGVTLSAADFAAIEKAVPKGAAAGARYPEALLKHMDSEK